MNVLLGDDKNNIDKLKSDSIYSVLCKYLFLQKKFINEKIYWRDRWNRKNLVIYILKDIHYFMLMGIFSITPIITYVMHEKLQQYHFSIISCGIMASAAILSIIVLCDFNKLKRVSTNYILYNNRKYIFMRE